MRSFSKVFFISAICFFLAIAIGIYSYLHENNLKVESELREDFSKNLNKTISQVLETKPEEKKIFSSLEEAIKESKRINLVILGLEDVRTDTIIFASFCPETKKTDFINIPRDTYIHRKGYNRAEERKINSIFAEHGSQGVRKAISHILGGMAVDHYISLDYDGVESIVDYLGGIEVDVPFHMVYKDPSSKPPLNINIAPGRQVLDGKESLDFLRYRKGNNGKAGYLDGDLGRIKAQQDFITSFIAKASDNLLGSLIKSFNHVKTDMSLMDALKFGKKALGMDLEDFSIHTLPGKGEFKKVERKLLSYFIYDKKETEELLKEIYNVRSSKDD